MKVTVDAEGLASLLHSAKRAGTVGAWADVAMQWINAANDELARLKRGEFKPEEIQEFCHKLPETVSAREFADGCAAYQRTLYGCAPDADRHPDSLLRQAAQQLRAAVGAFERNDAVDWGEFEACAAAIEGYLSSEPRVDTTSGLWKFAQWIASLVCGRAHGLAIAVCQGKTWDEAYLYCEEIGASRESRFIGVVAVPREPPAELIDSMCLRYRHDFGLDKIDGPISSGATNRERASIRSQMRQLYEEATGQGFYRFVEPKHVESVNCGFDRNASHSAGHYVCTCGFEDVGAEPAFKVVLDVKFRDGLWVICSDRLPGLYMGFIYITTVLFLNVYFMAD